ncbi:tripartite tricarboxylate transporter TctB family protein [Terrihabitans sp. B22-R8]|uniref:tripartite tricarboxylate transporter TctB family protein n=1 Tax=Terrihabitans sp. B22-R8 TaxID=3425128 RepID=UPI00403C428D
MSDAPNPATPHRPDWAVLVIAAALAGVAGVVAWDAAHLSTAVASYSRVGAAAFPYAIAAMLALCAIGTAISAFRTDFPAREPLEFGPLSWIIAGLVLQIALIGYAGFSISTGLLFALAARGFGGKPLWITIPAGIAFAFLLYLIFSLGLQLSLPQGPLERLV